jgi:hypothetical protein
MVSDIQSDVFNPAEAAALRQEARDLLSRLMADREQSDRRAIESGKRDPMKAITGRTALENAIVATREMVRHMDLLLAEMDGHLCGTASVPSAVAAPHRTPNRSCGKTSSVRSKLVMTFRPPQVAAAL